MTKKLYLLLLVALLFTFGCSKKSGMSEGSMAGGNMAMSYYESPQMAALAYDTSSTQWVGTGFNPEGPAGLEFKDMSNLYGRMETPRPGNAEPREMVNLDDFERKLEKRANVRIRAENLEEADASVATLMDKHNAYASSTGIEETAHRYTIRVPSSEYNAFLAETVSMGRLIYRNETTEDVTLRYYDLEGRLATKRELLRTFQSYLGRARNIEEILSVEARLADLQNEIDWTGKELRNLANRVDYATIDLTILGPVTTAHYGEPTIGEKFKTLFGSFGGFLLVLVVILVGIIIYGIPILLLLALFFWLFFGRIGLMKKLWRLLANKRVP